MPQVADDVHAPPLDLGRLGILVLVDHVLVGRFRHQDLGASRHPGAYERGQVEPGAAIEQQLVRDEVVRHLGARALLKYLVVTQSLYVLLEYERSGGRSILVRLDGHGSSLWSSLGAARDCKAGEPGASSGTGEGRSLGG